MIVAIGSENPVKVKAVERAFIDRLKDNIQFVQKKVPSGVSDQPFFDEIQQGAMNRAKNVREFFDADYGVGLEGGITRHLGTPMQYAWCAIVDRKGKISCGHSFGIPLPPMLMKKIETEGKELGDALDELLEDHNTKQKKGFFGFATGDLITREHGYYDMVCAALAPIALKEFYG